MKKPQEPAKQPETDKKPIPPAGDGKYTLRIAWQAPVASTAYRVGAGDTVGDGTDRLVLLLPLANGGVKVAVQTWDGKGFRTQWSAERPSTQPLLAVGRFAGKDKPAQIVLSSGYYQWKDGDYTFTEFESVKSPVGWVRMAIGDVLLLRNGREFQPAKLNLDAPGASAIEPDAQFSLLEPADGQAALGALHVPASELQAGVPVEFAPSGLMAFWDVLGDKKPARVLASATEKNAVVLTRDYSPTNVPVLWRSPDMPGRIADFAFGNPRKGEAGLLVLSASDDKGMGRTLTLYVPASPASRL